MAQIIKFQEGGTLTIDGVKYDINDHLISQYRFLGNEFDDSDQKKYYNQFMSTLKKGLTDKNVNIEIDRNKQYITGIDLSEYTEKQLKAIDVDQTDAGKLITHLFRPEVEGAKKAGKVLLDFNPSHPTSKFKHYSIDDKIILNHQYDQNTGEFIITDGKKQLVNGQDSKVTEITNRINFAKNIDNIPIHDKITGYNKETRDEIINTISDIGDLDAFKNRLLDGSYTEEDENRAKIFGIFMDTDTSEQRSNVQTQYAGELAFSNTGLPSSWASIITIGDDGVATLSDTNWLTSLNPGYTNYFLNNEFFEKYPQLSYLKGNSQNGLFVIGNKVYNADNLDKLPAEAKALVDAWVAQKIKDRGNVTNSNRLIYDDWFNDSNYGILNSDRLYEELGPDDLYGFDLQKYYDLDLPSFAFFDPSDKTQYNMYGDPILKYQILDNDQWQWYNNIDYSRRSTFKEGSPSLDSFKSFEYKQLGDDKIAYLGDIYGNNYNCFYNKTLNVFFVIDSENNIALLKNTITGNFDNDIDLDTVYTDQNFAQSLIKEFGIKNTTSSYKKGGKIQKCKEGTSTTWWNKTFPTDFALGTTGLIKSIIDSKKYYNQLKEANVLATLHSLPQNQSEIYPIYSENGLSHEVQQAKNRILNSKPKTSDVNANLSYDLVRNSQIAELDLNANKTRSQSIDQYKTNLFGMQNQYNKARTDVENKRRQMIGAMLGQNKQFDAEATQKIGDNIQKYLNEFRENRANEITRRNQYKLKAMESNAAGHYRSDLYHEFTQLGEWEKVPSDLREKYADDWVKYMEGEWADRANLIKQYAYRDLYDYMMNDPYGSIMSPLFKNWELPKSIYVPFHKSDGYNKLGWNIQSEKNGGKLNYIKTLYDRSENKDKDLIKIFSKL